MTCMQMQVLELAQSGARVVLLGHSKGAVDAAAAVSLYPELVDFVGGLVSLQGPHGGSAIAHDLANTELQKSVVLGALERLLRGCKHAVLDLSFGARQEFLRQHAYPLHRVPTLCVATADDRQSSLLTPLIEYVAVRYGEVCSHRPSLLASSRRPSLLASPRRCRACGWWHRYATGSSARATPSCRRASASSSTIWTTSGLPGAPSPPPIPMTPPDCGWRASRSLCDAATSAEPRR